MPYKVMENSTVPEDIYAANRRRIYYIKKDFQRRFILTYIAVVLGGVAFSGAMLNYLLNKNVDEVFYRAHVGIATTGEVTWSPILTTGATIFSLAVITILGVTSIYFWRINSGLNCLVGAVKGVKDGDLTVRMSSSQSDECSDLAKSFNEAVGSLNGKVVSVKSKLSELEEAVSSIKPEKADSINAILSRIDSLEEEMSAFRLK